jgi:hypothetical protein
MNDQRRDVLVGKPEGEKPGIDERMILKRILKA